MKFVLIFLFVPLFSLSQTVHTKDDRIFYEGKEKTTGVPSSEIIRRLRQVMQAVMLSYETVDSSNGSIKAKGQFRLNTPHRIIRTVDLFITVKPSDNGYDYVIDSVSMKETKRGLSTTVKSSKEILEEMEDFGKQAEDTERILNEIDLRIQQLLALMKKSMTADKTASL